MAKSIRKNFFWSILLNISGYLYSVLTFPYITRVLGAEGIGVANFAMSVVDYAILFSSLGITAIGIRYIAQNGNDEKKRNDVFNGLVTTHLLMSLTLLVVYFLCVCFLPQLEEHKSLYWVGALKIILNVFLVEWLFQGMQDFRYVTLRTLFIRTLYIIGIFVFVRDSNDYDCYFYVTISQIAINAFVNWRYSKRYVHFKFGIRKCKEYLFPIFSMGIDKILLSFYATFNVLFLGLCCGNASVGYYTTAIKLYALILSVIVAFNGVFVPYLNSLYSKGDLFYFRNVVVKSMELISMVAIPIIVVGMILAPQIILLVAGPGYERSVFPFRVILIQILVVGLSQVLKDQILLTFKRYKQILFVTSSTTLLSVLIIILFVPDYAEKATALAVAIPHVLEILLFDYYARKCIDMPAFYKHLSINILICVPIAAWCFWLQGYFSNYIIVLTLTFFVSFVYWVIIQMYVVKNKIFVEQINHILVCWKSQITNVKHG